MENIKLEHLESMSPSAVAEFPTSLLADLSRQLDAAQNHVKKLKTVLDAGIDEKFSATADTLRSAEGKDTGTVRIVDGEYVVIANLPKRPKWDQKQLVQIFNDMDPALAAHYAKAEYKVDERKFTAAPPDIHEKLMAARTVETGKPSYKIEEVE